MLSISFKSAWYEIEEVYDAQLVSFSKVLLQLLEYELLEEDGNDDFTILDDESALKHKYEKNIALRVWHNNKLITQSNSATNFTNVQAPPGFSDQIIENEKWRFFVFLEVENNIRVETSERYSIRYELIFDIIASLIIPVIIFIPLVLIIVWRAIKTNLEAVVSISANVDQRNSDDLGPIVFNRLPQEIAPIINAINALFERLSYSFQREKEFTDHAAHELRTPLAAMKTQAQVIQKRMYIDSPVNEDIGYLLDSINRSSNLVNQLLQLSRLQNTQFTIKKVELSKYLIETIDNLKKLIKNKNIYLLLNISEHVFIDGDKNSLSVMFKNIIENSIKYTPENGSITISLFNNGIFSTEDTGPGIDECKHEEVFKRFVRADKTGQDGSGLGLSIVKWIVDAHAATIKLSNAQPSGLAIEIKFVKK
jgi:signal transduction histidine kinase